MYGPVAGRYMRADCLAALQAQGVNATKVTSAGLRARDRHPPGRTVAPLELAHAEESNQEEDWNCYYAVIPRRAPL